MKNIRSLVASSLIALSTTCFSSSLIAQDPYDLIRLAPATGYYLQSPYVYAALINERKCKVIIDVESHEGSVARFLGQQHQSEDLPSINKIYSINAWEDDEENKFQFQRFLSNVKYEDTTKLITPIRMSSHEAAVTLNIKADFISLVGKNNPDILYRDILSWYPHLSEDGIICGNNWHEPGVSIGVAKAAEALELTIKLNDHVWYFEKNF